MELQYLFALLLLPCVLCSPQCSEQHLCYCLLPNSSYIDINPLANVTFDLINMQGQYRYAIDLCKPFNKSDECTDVFGCQYNNETQKFHSLGKGLPTFIDVKTLMFENETNKVFVELVCSESQDDFQFANQFTGDSPFNFTLKSKYACAINGSSPSNSTTLTSTVSTSSSVKTTTGSAPPTTGSNSTTSNSSSGGTTKAAPTSATTQSRDTTTAKIQSTTHGGSASVWILPTTSIFGAVLLSRLLI